ncbi:MAG: hypothetical protein QM695_10345 [Micropruina sp.]
MAEPYSSGESGTQVLVGHAYGLQPLVVRGVPDGLKSSGPRRTTIVLTMSRGSMPGAAAASSSDLTGP